MRSLLMRLPARVRVLLRRGIAAVFLLGGTLGIARLTRGKLSLADGSTAPLDTALAGTAVCTTIDVDEPPPVTDLVYQHGPDIRPRRLHTVHLVVDSRDPRFSFRNNVVLDHRRRVVAEERIPADELPVSFSFLEPARHRSGTVVYLSNTNVGNFYHWITLTLPLLRIYREQLAADPDAFYVGRPLTGWHRETLDMLGIPEARVLTEGVSADRLVAAISNRQYGAIDTASLDFVREELGRPRFATTRTRRLFIGRGDVAFRRFVNEKDCFDLLADRYGFDYVTMDGKTVAEEIELFSSAEAIVGVHGAALTNLLWAHPSCRVLELMPYGWNHPGYQEIAAFVGCTYAYIVGSADVPRAAGPATPDAVRRENDLRVGISELLAASQALGFSDV